MKIRLGLTQKFLAPTLVALTLFGAVLIYRVNSLLRQGAIERAQNIIADFIRIQSRQHVTSPADFSLVDHEKTEQVFGKVLEGVKTAEVIRIKVWDKDGTIIFANDKSIVGKNFRENEDFQKSIGGEIAADIKAPLKAENATEKGYAQLMEVYVPVEFRSGEKPVGVIEVYYKLDGLNKSILEAQREVTLVMASGFLLLAVILWLLIHFIVIRPLQTLEAEITSQSQRERERERERVKIE